ncbi:MAG: branched-chain amino acid ABC transporter permease [Deltaproteobacteria bacterium]|nr:branched-chain amino acid ABC transporter permease [Deltaproteobacteria bacterium]MBW2071105.1 branched-chain amino acid ABC transporter permease [Deltaproteobacteria bacterium]
MPSGLFHTNYEDDEKILQTLWLKCWMWGFLVFLFVVFPNVASSLSAIFGINVLHMANMIGIFIIGAHGLNILTGFTGQISLGHGAFMGVGAYTSGILFMKAGWPLWLSLPAAGLVTAAVGMIFGVPSLRLRGLYLAIATMAAQFIIEYTMRNWTSLTGGSAGLNIDPPVIAGLALDTDKRYFYLVFVLVVASTLFLKNLLRTKTGRAFVAVRDRYLSAEIMGVNLFKYRLLSFGISSFYVGVAGGLFAHYNMIISDEHFTMWLSIQYLAMVIIGGLGHVLGGIFGTIFMVLLPELLRIPSQALSNVYPNIFAIFGTLRELVFGVVIILFLIFEPDGLAARWHTVRAYWKLWPFSY